MVMEITHEVGKYYYYPGVPFWIYLVKETEDRDGEMHVNGDKISIDKDGPEYSELEIDEWMISALTIDDGTRLATSHEIDFFKRCLEADEILEWTPEPEVNNNFPIY